MLAANGRRWKDRQRRIPMLDAVQFHEEIRGGKRIPFSLCCGGEAVTWMPITVRTEEQGRTLQCVRAYRVAGLPLTVTLRALCTPSASLMTYRFTLRADCNIEEAIGDVNLLDLDLPMPASGAHIRGFRGGSGRDLDDWSFPRHEFGIIDRDLAAGPVAWEDLSGRSSQEYLPIWFLHGGNRGFWFGPEWSGSWGLRMAAEGERVLCRLSLPAMHFVMYQGEELRFPAVSLGSYEGDVEAGCKALRRTIRDEIMPRIDGERSEPTAVHQILTGLVAKLDGEGMKREVEAADRVGIENFVFASCWYRSHRPTSVWSDRDRVTSYNRYSGRQDVNNFWELVGDYEPHPDRFPEGMDAFVLDLQARGMAVGLWYEPRVSIHAEAYGESHDVLLPCFSLKKPAHDGSCMQLIDLGTAEGRAYQLAVLEDLVRLGARWIWHDLNVPLRRGFWDHLEEHNRRGIKELKYMDGMHQVYDEFLARHPDVRVEWCASGGNMIDLGSIRRAHTIWVTDYTDMLYSMGNDYNTDAGILLRARLNTILPAALIMNAIYSPSQVRETGRAMGMDNILPQLAGTFCTGQYLQDWDPRDLESAAQAVGAFKSMRHLLHGDFHSLLPVPSERSDWTAWQFHDPESEEGLIFVFRLSQCEERTKNLELRGLDGRNVQVECLLGEGELDADGTGLHVELTGRAVLWRYRACE
jgi:hypothetical protein